MWVVVWVWAGCLGAVAALKAAAVGGDGRRLAYLHHAAPVHHRTHTSGRLSAESLPLTTAQVDQLESEYVGFEAEQPAPPKCPIMAHHLSNRIVKAIVEHDMDMLTKRSVDASGRPTHLQQKWRMARHGRRLDPVLFRVGEKLKGRVAVAFPTYALVDVGSTSYGVLHARDMSEGWIDRVDHSVSSGDDIVVIVKSIDEDARFLRLSLLELPKLEGPTGEPIERRPLQSFKVEEAVCGVVRRRSPFGYYVDVGATVDGFLHVNDRRLPRKYTGVARLPLRIGTRVPTLYVKSVDLVKNRLQLSENSLREEMEKRCLTGQETPGQQAVYNPERPRSLLERLQLRDLEHMRMIGGYDDLLKEIGGTRNASEAYVLYLRNRKLREHLERQRDTVLDDADNMSAAQLRRATKEYNRLSMEIAELDDEAVEPPPCERTVYKYGDADVWESRVYTPFDEKDPSSYFQTVTDEVTAALRDVQGESYDYKGALADDLSSEERRGEIVESLWERFHAAPSDKSRIKDTEPRQATLEDVEDLVPASLVSEDGVAVGGAPDPDTVVAELESYNDPDADELAEMIRGAAGFNPFDHSSRLVDDDQSALLGACAMTNEDVTRWQARFDRLCEDAGVDLASIDRDTLGAGDVGKRDRHDSGSFVQDMLQSVNRDDMSAVPSVDEFVDSTQGATSDVNFVAPTVEGSDEVSDDGSGSGGEDPLSAPYDEGSDLSDVEYLSGTDDSSYESSDDDVDLDDYSSEPYGTDADEEPGFLGEIGGDSSDEDDYREVAGSFFEPKDAIKAGSRAKPSRGEGRGLTADAAVGQQGGTLAASTPVGGESPNDLLPQGPLEPVDEFYRPSTIADEIQDIFKEVRAMTSDGPPSAPEENASVGQQFGNGHVKKTNHRLHMRRCRHLDPVARLHAMSKVPRRPLPVDAEVQSDDEETDAENDDAYGSGYDDEVSDYDAGTRGNIHDIDADYSDDFDLELGGPVGEGGTGEVKVEDLKKVRSLARSIGNSDQRRRTLARMARRALPPEVVAKYRFDDKDPAHMEEMASLLRGGKARPKLTPYTYYPEGIDAAALGRDRRSMNRRIRDANLKLAKLKRNKRFLHMLDRLGVDPEALTFENIHQALPQELLGDLHLGHLVLDLELLRVAGEHQVRPAAVQRRSDAAPLAIDHLPNGLLDGADGDEVVDVDDAVLGAHAVGAVLGLDHLAGHPVQLGEDDGGRSGEVEADATGSERQQSDAALVVGLEAPNVVLALGLGGGAVDAHVVAALLLQGGLDGVQHGAVVREDDELDGALEQMRDVLANGLDLGLASQAEDLLHGGARLAVDAVLLGERLLGLAKELRGQLDGHAGADLGGQLLQHGVLEAADHDGADHEVVELEGVLRAGVAHAVAVEVELLLAVAGEERVVRAEAGQDAADLLVELRRGVERGRAGEQNDALGALEERDEAAGAPGLAVLQVVRLVANDDAEAVLEVLVQRVEVVGDDDDARKVGNGGFAILDGADLVRLDEVGQPPLALVVPLEAQRGGADDEQRPVLLVEGRYRERLERLAEAHLVADEDAAVAVHAELHALALEGAQLAVELLADEVGEAVDVPAGVPAQDPGDANDGFFRQLLLAGVLLEGREGAQDEVGDGVDGALAPDQGPLQRPQHHVVLVRRNHHERLLVGLLSAQVLVHAAQEVEERGGQRRRPHGVVVLYLLLTAPLRVQAAAEGLAVQRHTARQRLRGRRLVHRGVNGAVGLGGAAVSGRCAWRRHTAVYRRHRATLGRTSAFVLFGLRCRVPADAAGIVAKLQHLPGVVLGGVAGLVEEPEDGVEQREDAEEQADNGERDDDEEVDAVAHEDVQLLVGVLGRDLAQVGRDGVVVGEVVAGVAEVPDGAVDDVEVAGGVDAAAGVDGGADADGHDGQDADGTVDGQHEELEGLEAEDPAEGADDVTGDADQGPDETQAEAPVVPAGGGEGEGDAQAEADAGDDDHDLGGVVRRGDHSQHADGEERVAVFDEELVELGAHRGHDLLGHHLEHAGDGGVTLLHVHGAHRGGDTAVGRLADGDDHHGELEARGDEVREDEQDERQAREGDVHGTGALEQVESDGLDVLNGARPDDLADVEFVRRDEQHEVADDALERHGVHVEAQLRAVDAVVLAEGTHFDRKRSSEAKESVRG
ncbi:S1 RNA binding domain-containing protein [Babesia caballi]|uniref:S1 RNA binding domain-containing protein n=1 Tax=Babesia caballi TaxID=5871 RepID=A0AAV4LMR4_BABCB|nr:S1 RNA binding domain-containing protein [Babesia caballi]